MYSDKKNSFWLSIQYLSTLIFSFVTLKLNLLVFGQQLFGVWVLFTSFWGISSVIDLGFGTAIVKYIADARNKKDNIEVNKIVSVGFFIFITLGILLIIAGDLLGFIIYFNNPNLITKQTVSEAKLVFLLLGLSFYLRYITSFFKSVFEGIKDFVLPSKLSLVYNCFILISSVIVFVFKLNLTALAFCYFLSSSIITFGHYFFIKKQYKDIHIKRSFINLNKISVLFKFSFSVQVTSVFGALIDPLIKYFIGSFISVETVSSYEVARRFSVAISGLFATSFRTILPKASILATKEEYNEFIMSEGIKITKLGVVYSGMVYGVMSIFIIAIIKLWFGIEQSIFIFFILSLPEIVNNAGYALFMICLGIGKAFHLAIIQMLNLILTSLSLLLGIWLFKGYLGLLGYFFSEILVNMFLILLIKRFSNISIKNYLKNIGFNKLMIFLAMILTVIALGISFNFNLYMLSSILSFLSIMLFWKDAGVYIKIFWKMIIVDKLRKQN